MNITPKINGQYLSEVKDEFFKSWEIEIGKLKITVKMSYLDPMPIAWGFADYNGIQIFRSDMIEEKYTPQEVIDVIVEYFHELGLTAISLTSE